MTAPAHTPVLPALKPGAAREVLTRVLDTLERKFYKPELLDTAWRDRVEQERSKIENAENEETLEQGVTALLRHLNTSHLGFFHRSAQRASSRAALSATYLSVETDFGVRWVFQDVHDGGAAAIAGVQPGDILLHVDGREIFPPEHPVFPMGHTSEVEIDSEGTGRRLTTVRVAAPKGKKLHFVEPTLVQRRLLSETTGYLKIAMFPGMIGVDVANRITREVDALGPVERLIIDLRGNTGGGVGALRAMSLLTPEKLPVGFAANKAWADRDLENEKKIFPRFTRIPQSKRALWLLGLRFLPSLARKVPVVLQTEGLGPRSFHGHITLLVDRHTASAAEMIVMFAKENRLANVVGEATAGRLLSATSVKVGHGFRLALPTGAYYTWQGTALEGSPIQPDVSAAFEWQESRDRKDTQLTSALQVVETDA